MPNQALLFSGEKIHSHVCIYCARNGLILCGLVNTVPAYPDLEQMARIRAMVPHFHEVKSRQISGIRLATDLLSIAVEGRDAHLSHGRSAFQSTLDCCHGSIWRRWVRAIGIWT